MKPILSIFFSILFSTASYSQKSTFKLGANLHSDIIEHKNGRLIYPGFEVNYEWQLSRKFSLNIGYNYSNRKLESAYDWKTIILYAPYTNYLSEMQHTRAHVFLPEIRYYLKSSEEGLFFQAGMPFTYEETHYERFSSVSEYTFVDSYRSLTCIFGLGLKYKFNMHLGMELIGSISPSFNLLNHVDYGSAGFIKSGIKILYAI